jgi:predicted RNase H-like nuclease (RuvC/YqgF family)
MADEATQDVPEQVEAEESVEAQEPEVSEDSEAHAEGESEGTDWKAEARKWESRAKENKTAADELERLRAEKEELAGKVSEFQAREERAGWAREVATSAGVPAELIRGETREEMEAHAESLKAFASSLPRGPVVGAQGKTGQVKVADPKREAVQNLFGNKD